MSPHSCGGNLKEFEGTLQSTIESCCVDEFFAVLLLRCFLFLLIGGFVDTNFSFVYNPLRLFAIIKPSRRAQGPIALLTGFLIAV
jgi:hypothetical protein